MQLKIIIASILSIMLSACESQNEKMNIMDNPLAESGSDTIAQSSGEPMLSPKEEEPQEQKEEKQNPFTDSSFVPSSNQNKETNAPASNPDWDKKIIKTATISAECSDYKGFSNIIHAKTKQYGAYISQEQEDESDYKISNTITIKIPVAMFDEFVNSLEEKGTTIKEKNITSEDVTTEYVDTKSRLQAKITVRDKYLELLKEAKTMDDIIRVQDEINDIQEEIEAAAGRTNYLKHLSAYSTINITYYQYLNGSSEDEDNPGFFTKIGKAFKTGGSIISNSILLAISVWPLVVAGIILFVYIRKRKISSSKNNNQTAIKDNQSSANFTA